MPTVETPKLIQIPVSEGRYELRPKDGPLVGRLERLKPGGWCTPGIYDDGRIRLWRTPELALARAQELWDRRFRAHLEWMRSERFAAWDQTPAGLAWRESPDGRWWFSFLSAHQGGLAE